MTGGEGAAPAHPPLRRRRSKTTCLAVALLHPQESPLREPFARWFAERGWAPREHQLELLGKARAGRSALLIAPTGAGKTLAGFLPTLVELAQRPVARGLSSGGLHTLYTSPLKALAIDVHRNLERPVEEMRLPIRIET